jgi:hypothetical protein
MWYNIYISGYNVDTIGGIMKDNFIRIRITSQEKAEIQKKADRKQRTLSDYCRLVLKGDKR